MGSVLVYWFCKLAVQVAESLYIVPLVANPIILLLNKTESAQDPSAANENLAKYEGQLSMWQCWYQPFASMRRNSS